MKHNKLLLINPWIHDFAAYDYWMRPLGFLYIAAVLRRLRYEIYYVDCRDRFHPELTKLLDGRLPRSREDGRGNYHKQILKKADVVKDIPRRFGRYGITPEIFLNDLSNIPEPNLILMTSGMTYWYPGVQETVKLTKHVFPKIPILLGGIYPTLIYNHAVRNSGADFILKGVDLVQIVEQADRLTGNHSNLNSIPKDLDEYPYPAFDLLRKNEFIAMLTSTGCPYHCHFCASERIYPHYKQRSPLKVVEEIEYHANKYHTKHFVFYDDALFLNANRHIKVILRKIIEKNLGLNFHTPNGLFTKHIDEELADLMVESGFVTVRLSLESYDKARQQEMGFKVTNSDFMTALENLARAGFDRSKIETYILMGLPKQSMAEVMNSMLFAHEQGVTIRLSSYSPIPGTMDWFKAVKECGLDPDADPLTLNNSVFPLRSEEIPFEMYQQMNTFGKVLNHSLRNKTESDKHPDVPGLIRKKIA